MLPKQHLLSLLSTYLYFLHMKTAEKSIPQVLKLGHFQSTEKETGMEKHSSVTHTSACICCWCTHMQKSNPTPSKLMSTLSKHRYSDIKRQVSIPGDTQGFWKHYSKDNETESKEIPLNINRVSWPSERFQARNWFDKSNFSIRLFTIQSNFQIMNILTCFPNKFKHSWDKINQENNCMGHCPWQIFISYFLPKSSCLQLGGFHASWKLKKVFTE